VFTCKTLGERVTKQSIWARRLPCAIHRHPTRGIRYV
jgi:hypothetical protein